RHSRARLDACKRHSRRRGYLASTQAEAQAATRRSRLDAASDAGNGAENETQAEVQRLERDALVVSVHTVFIGLRHRKRKNPVRLDAESAKPRAVGDAGAQVWHHGNPWIDLV